MSLAGEAPDLFAFVEKSCVGCHNAKLKSGDVDLKSLETAKTFEENREIWEKVVEREIVSHDDEIEAALSKIDKAGGLYQAAG